MRLVRFAILAWSLPPLAAGAAQAIPPEKAVIQFQTTYGRVIFNHALHAELRTTRCESCHHTHQAGRPFQPCSECHKDKETAVPGFSAVPPSTAKAYHLKCRGCHEYTLKELAQPAGPTKCTLCHIRGE